MIRLGLISTRAPTDQVPSEPWGAIPRATRPRTQATSARAATLSEGMDYSIRNTWHVAS